MNNAIRTTQYDTSYVLSTMYETRGLSLMLVVGSVAVGSSVTYHNSLRSVRKPKGLSPIQATAMNKEKTLKTKITNGPKTEMKRSQLIINQRVASQGTVPKMTR